MYTIPEVQLKVKFNFFWWQTSRQNYYQVNAEEMQCKCSVHEQCIQMIGAWGIQMSGARRFMQMSGAQNNHTDIRCMYWSIMQMSESGYMKYSCIWQVHGDELLCKCQVHIIVSINHTNIQNITKTLSNCFNHSICRFHRNQVELK